MTQGATKISHEVYDLHMLVIYICVVIGIVVFGAMIWSMIFHRKSKGAVAAKFHESTKVEIMWTVIPVLILIGMAWPATKTLLAMEDNNDSALSIEVTGSQWKWHYKYLNEGVEFYSNLATPRSQWDNLKGSGDKKDPYYLREVDNPLVIPAHEKVRFLVGSADVIHSWWVPAFAVKQDAIPGFINEAWANVDEPGTYRGQCAELCGKDHGFMPIVVKVLPQAEFKTWLASQQEAEKAAKAAEKASLTAKLSKDDLMKLGEKTYLAHCAACHQPNGQGLPPTFPALKGSKIALGDIGKHINIVLHGKPGSAMPAWDKQLTFKEIAAVVTYERNAWGNNTGDTLQPADINAAMKGGSDATTPAAAAKPAPQAAKKAAPESAADTGKPLNLEESMAFGKDVYLKHCAACHQPGGTGLPPTFPALKGGPIATGDINKHLDIVLHGKPGSAMPAWDKQLNDKEIAAVITYERNAWGNNTGDLVKISDVKAAIAK
jgi:cytochrome c oxidase subunit 2